MFQFHVDPGITIFFKRIKTFKDQSIPNITFQVLNSKVNKTQNQCDNMNVQKTNFYSDAATRQ